MKRQFICLLAMVASSAAFAAGFGIYEASARGNALGGALVGSTKDASAVYYNPANMTEMTNMSVMVGATLVGLWSDIKVDGIDQHRMDPGLFGIPSFYFTSPLPWDFAFGLGLFCENGLGTKYSNRWLLAGDTVETTIMQFTLNPNLAYKITDWWSVSAGMRASYITFNNIKHPYAGMAYPYNTGMGYMMIPDAYHLTSELDGDDIALGYNLGTTFKLLQNLSLGIVYRSEIRHEIEGDFDMNGDVAGQPMRMASNASANLNLPQSVSAGLNWDATDDLRLGTVVTWTDWRSVDTINFRIPATGGYSMPLNWGDVWRFGFGAEYDLTDCLVARCGYVYDMDPSDDKYGTTMLPGGDRHIIGLGFGWNIWDALWLDIGYNVILMCDDERDITVAGPTSAQDRTYHFENYDGYSHLISASISYTF